ncbi:hypothetical protein CG418_18210 [Shigella flexneri]|nr:hypothetical protein CG418_18210 [Shigella flexneri]
MIVLILVFRLVIGEQIIDVLGPEKRRRRTTQEKIAIVQQSFEPGMTVSLVARQHGVAASQLFLWRKQYQEGSLTAVAAGEQVVKWHTEFGHLNRGDMLTSEQHRCSNEKKKF